MVKQTVKEWIAQEQGKHFCQCGCGGEIKIRPSHYTQGIPTYIRGHFIRTEEQNLKISKSLIGIKRSEETKRKMSEAQKINKSNYGKHLSEETKRKMRATIKDKYTGKNSPMFGRRGKDSNNWQGGISFGKYCYKFDNKCKENNRDKFNRKCFLCGKQENNNIMKNGKQTKLPVHHVDSDKEQGCESNWNLVPLCTHCHGKVHGKNIGEYYEWLLSTMLYYREMIFEYEGNIDYRSF